MTDLLVPGKPEVFQPSISITTVARQAQIAKLFRYMTDNQVSWTSACRDLGFDRGTMKRWLAKTENKELLSKFRAMELETAVQVCSSGLVQIAEGQVEIASDPNANPADRTRAAAWVEKFLATHTKNSQEDSEDTLKMAQFKATFNLLGPMTFSVEKPDTLPQP